jgi:glycerophosphoryl diester phosphodiesterase
VIINFSTIIMNFPRSFSIPVLVFISFLIMGLVQCTILKPPAGRPVDAKAANVVVAHRGAWKNTGHPQNSVASLKAALALGCGGSEFDIHMTSDSVLVINHDPDYFGIPIQHTQYIGLGEKKLANGETIPLLKDFIELGKSQTGTKLILEIKPSVKGKEWAMATTQQVVQMVKDMNAKEHCLYISFDYDILMEILRLDPGAKVQYLKGDKEAEILIGDGLHGADYTLSAYKKIDGFIETAKSKGLKLNAWTINSTDEMNELLDKGFDFITTDEPEMLLELLKNRSRY